MKRVAVGFLVLGFLLFASFSQANANPAKHFPSPKLSLVTFDEQVKAESSSGQSGTLLACAGCDYGHSYYRERRYPSCAYINSCGKSYYYPRRRWHKRWYRTWHRTWYRSW